PDQRLQGLLVLEFKPYPIRGPRHFGDPHLIDVADEVVIVVPPADPHPRRALDVQHWLGRAVEPAVDVNPAVPSAVGVYDMNPLRHGESRFALHVGKIAVHVEVRRAAKLHAHFTSPPAPFVTPTENRRIRSFRPEP